MGLIKSANTPSSLASFSMQDIEMQARMMLLRARQQAEALLAAAQTEADQLRQAAHAEGFMQGREEGHRQGSDEGMRAGREQGLAEHRAELQQALGALHALLGEIEASRHALQADALSEVVELSIAMARRITKRQGLIDPDVLAANLEEAMKVVVSRADVRVAIHPSQRQTLDAALPQLQMQWPQLERVNVIDDPALSPGGCRVYTENGIVDADLEGQLDRIAADLLPTKENPIP